jgi:hypothetical protein
MDLNPAFHSHANPDLAVHSQADPEPPKIMQIWICDAAMSRAGGGFLFDIDTYLSANS